MCRAKRRSTCPGSVIGIDDAEGLVVVIRVGHPECDVRPKKPLTREAGLGRFQTVYRVAKDSGIAFMVVSRFYKGERSLTLNTADKQADYFASAR